MSKPFLEGWSTPPVVWIEVERYIHYDSDGRSARNIFYIAKVRLAGHAEIEGSSSSSWGGALHSAMTLAESRAVQAEMARRGGIETEAKLTDERIREVWDKMLEEGLSPVKFARAIESEVRK